MTPHAITLTPVRKTMEAVNANGKVMQSGLSAPWVGHAGALAAACGGRVVAAWWDWPGLAGVADGVIREVSVSSPSFFVPRNSLDSSGVGAVWRRVGVRGR